MAAESAEFKRKQREELIHAFSWPEHALQTIQSSRFAATVQSVGESAHQRLAALRDAMDGDTLSTAFSGIDAPATAIHMICDALDQQPSARQTKLIVTSAVEYLAESQNELLMLSKSNPQFCCFGDITSFYRQEIKGVVEEMSKKAYPAAFEALKPVIKSGKAMTLTSYCRRHDKMCRMQPARRHVAGTPCTDHSSMGKREGQDGKTAICYLAWVGLRLALQEPIIVQENVTSFKIIPVGVLRRNVLHGLLRRVRLRLWVVQQEGAPVCGDAAQDQDAALSGAHERVHEVVPPGSAVRGNVCTDGLTTLYLQLLQHSMI